MSNSHRTDDKLRCSAVLAAVAGCLLSCAGWAAGAKPESNVAPQVPSAAATNAASPFRIQHGFRLQLVAAEPVVTAPVAMAFDENGRLFVVERPEEPQGNRTNAPSGRIRLLEQTEGEEEFHASTVYADHLSRVSALACYRGGLFVAAGPDLIYLKDSKTNGIADVRNVIFTGFGSTNPVHPSALPNNFNWGMDNRIHAASAGIAAFVPGSSAPDAGPVSLAGADFSFDPRALTVSAEAGPGQAGLSFDNWGRKFTCDFMRPLRSPRYELRYLARNPFFLPPPPMFEVASPATALFGLPSAGLSSLAPARLRAKNDPAVAQATNGWVASWLTNAQGCVVYRGNAFPTNFFGNAFIADPSAHLIHRFVLHEAGLGLAAARATDATNAEFVVSPDASFHPVQIVNGPDGTLYVADRQDASDRGRIYRILPPDFKQPKPPRLGKATTYGLVATLSHPNGWQRDTAARLLYERRDPEAVPLLASQLAASPVPLARVHALHALDGLGALNPTYVLNGLRDPEDRIREHAVLLSEKLVRGGAFPDAVWAQLRSMAADPSVRVRYQLAFTVGELHQPGSAQVLAAILLRDAANPWMQAAVFSSLADGAGDLCVALARDARVRRDPVGQECLRRLAAMIGVRNRPVEVSQVVGLVADLRSEPLSAFALLYALGDGLHRARASLALADPGVRLRPLFDLAQNAVLNYSAPEPLRIGGLQLLGVGPFTFANTGDLLLLQVGSGQSEAIQAAALATLGRFNDPRIAPAVMQRWRLLTPRLRNEAFAALLARADRVESVVAALESGLVSRVDLSYAQVNFLRTCRDPGISERAQRLLGPVPRQRPEAMQRFRPALALKGDPAGGRDIFLARCAACHQRGGAMQAVGPDLVGARIYGKERLLSSILQPSAAVRGDCVTYAVETAEGESLIGLLRDENPATTTLQRSDGRAVVLPRANIAFLRAQPWSLMPAGMEEGLTPQNMADLLEYVITAAP